jgi:hypothetical protein
MPYRDAGVGLQLGFDVKVVNNLPPNPEKTICEKYQI